MTRAAVSLARALSKLGVASRTVATEWILAGRVTVGGASVLDPAHRVDPSRDAIAVDGRAAAAARRVYLVLNKPRGVVTTARDERGRATVYGCLEGADLPWVTPVGRLDRASEGLLLLTNDTRWADRILDPASHLDKVYHVRIDRLADPDLLARMLAGVEVDGELLRAKAARQLRAGRRTSWLEITLDEGRNRQIRRMLEAQGVRVLRLVRVAIGPLRLGELAKGEHRPLTAREKAELDHGSGAERRRGPQGPVDPPRRDALGFAATAQKRPSAGGRVRRNGPTGPRRKGFDRSK